MPFPFIGPVLVDVLPNMPFPFTEGACVVPFEGFPSALGGSIELDESGEVFL